jgi:hypothetical protein
MTKRSNQTDKKATEDSLTEPIQLSLAKEYALYSDAHVTEVHTTIDTMIDQSQRLRLNTYQSFVRNLFNPLSEHKSLLLIHGTGTGKTITSLSVAIEYQKQYREYISLEKTKTYHDIRSVIVVGYTRDIFKDELITHPEFGFISPSEVTELRDLQKTEHESNAIAEKLTNLKHKLYRRVSDRRMNGIFQFYGYRQLFNRVINNDDLVGKIKTMRGMEVDLTKIEPDQIRKWIQDGSVRLNKMFIETLKHCLLICDEVHNIYYQNDVNAYGLAIEIINDYFNEPKLYNPNWTPNNENCIRWLFLSATPLASSPTEIIPIINLMNQQANRVQYSDLFDSTTKDLTTKGLNLIARRVDGHISYIMDDNPIQYPTSSFVGNTIEGIPYLKFIRCRMSKVHQAAYNKYLSSDHHASPDVVSDDILSKSNTLKDFVFQSGNGPDDNVLYKYSEVQEEIKSNVSPYKEDSTGLLVSDTFAQSILSKYSEKYSRIMQQIIALKGLEHGKIFVYHPYVQATGTNLLASIFRANGLLELDEQPADTSICMICARLYKAHNCNTKNKLDVCDFIPVRFTIVTGYNSKTTTTNRLNQFNSPENSNGEQLKILLGSRAMRESHTLKACRHLMVTHQPSSISELIQIVGRGVRKHSHSLLPTNDRNIKLYIFVSSMHSGATLSSEEQDYFEKMRLYKQILSIERVLFDQSLDYLINFRFKRREVPKLIGESFPLHANQYATMKAYPVTRIGSVRSNTFYFDQEIAICVYLIKRILFEYQPVISKTDLLTLIRAPPFSVDADLTLISDGAIEYALNDLCYEQTSSQLIDHTNNAATPIESLFDNSKQVIGMNGQQFCIKCAMLGKEMVIYMDSVSNPTNDLHKLITKSDPVKADPQLDLEVLANHWDELVQIDEIITELQIDFVKSGTIQGAIMIRIKQFTLETHTKLVEYCIIAIISRIFHNKKLTCNPKLLIELVGFYQEYDILITIKDTIHTIIGSLYKKYAIQTGASWAEVVLGKNKFNRINYSGIPIGHYVKHSPKVISIDSLTSNNLIWNEYSSIVQVNPWTFPFKLFGYDERGVNIESVFKIKDLSDKKSKGINPMFMQQVDLQKIAKRLNIKISLGDKKLQMVAQIKHFIMTTEIRYRREGNANKIFYHSYENIHAT